MCVLKHTSLHHRSTTHRSLSLSSTIRSNDPWLFIQALHFFYSLIGDHETRPTLTMGNAWAEPQELHKQVWTEKAKTKAEAVCFSKNYGTGNYSDFSTSPDFLCCPGNCTHTSQLQYLTSATLQARESKEKPSLSPWSQIWLKEKALTFLVSPG